MLSFSPRPDGEALVRVISAPVPGRARLAVGGLQRNAERGRAVEAALRDLAGVRAVEASIRTGNVLVVFDPTRCSADQLARRVAESLGASEAGLGPSSRPRVTIRSATPGRLRLAVAVLRRRPECEASIARAVTALPGVRAATASALTGTVLIRYAPERWTVEALRTSVEQALGRVDESRPGRTDEIGQSGSDAAPPTLVAAADTTLRPPAVPEDKPRAAWHALSASEVAEALAVEPTRGLRAAEVAERRARWGSNRLAEPEETPLLDLFVDQFKNAPAVLLAAGTALSLATGALLEAGLIAGVLVVNAVIGAGTERSSQRAIRALRHSVAIRARVRRDGREQTIDADELVPGDVVLVRNGDSVPADARLVSAERLRVEESTLTGESRPVEKRLNACAADTPLADRTDLVHRGTTVVGGHGAAIVVETGDRTVYGGLRLLAGAAEAPPTPLERDLDRLGRGVAVGATAICAAVFGLSLWRGVGLLPAISTAVGLGVAAIPEALPTIATTVLALGSGRMRRNGTLIRTLSAAEGLGSVTHVCADKTGTLTENRMAARELYVEGRVVRVVGPALSPSGTLTVDGQAVRASEWPALAEALRIGALCSDADVTDPREPEVTFDGSPTEAALLIAGLKAGIDVAALRAACPILDRRDRAEGRRYMLTVHRRAGRLVAAMKGSPEAVLALCNWVIGPEGPEPLSAARRLDEASRNADMASRALRVLGLAERELPEDYREADLESGFVWYGLVGLADPIRPAVPAAIQALHAAGIRTIMITGDQPLTAVAVARELQLSRRGALNTLEAGDLVALDPETVRELVREVGIFARVPPEMKLVIVRALQANGKIVAMTGDGVNDAPALRAADVGVAMGERGTELARELADVVLSTDDFAQIVDAVAEGRLVRANVRRVLHYLLGTNAAEVWVVIGATAVGLAAPLNALQLLWLNLVTDVAPAIALAVEPRDPSLMAQPPRDPREPIIPRPLAVRMLAESAVIALAALGVFGLGLRRYGPGPAAQTMAFATLVTAQLLHAPLARVGNRSALLTRGPGNRWLALALGVSGALQAAALFFPPLRAALGGAALGLADLLLAGGGALAAVGAIEAERLVRGVAHSAAGCGSAAGTRTVAITASATSEASANRTKVTR